MGQLSGAFTIETARLVEEIAERVAQRVGELLALPAGTDVYDRPAAPDPGAGGRHGARFGAVLENGITYDDPAAGS